MSPLKGKKNLSYFSYIYRSIDEKTLFGSSHELLTKSSKVVRNDQGLQQAFKVDPLLRQIVLLKKCLPLQNLRSALLLDLMRASLSLIDICQATYTNMVRFL